MGRGQKMDRWSLRPRILSIFGTEAREVQRWMEKDEGGEGKR